MSILQPCPSRPLAICGLLFFEGFIDEAAQPGADVEVPLDDEELEAFPPGITVEGATPKTRGGRVARGLATFPPARGAPAAKMRGSLPPLPPLLCGATTRRARRGRAVPAPHYPLPQRTRGIRANPLPMRLSGHNLDHTGEDFAL